MNKDHPLYGVFLKILQKQRKPHCISRLDQTKGSVLAIGNPGAGKTSGNRRSTELRWQLNHKIFCLYDGGSRMDMCFFMFESNSPYWRKPKVERGKIVGPRRYPVELLYPVSKTIPKSLPHNSVLFTIPVSDLTENDLVAMVGSGSRDSIKGAFSYIKDKVNENTTPHDFLNIMGNALKKSEDPDNIKPSHHGFKKIKTDVLKPLINQGILSSKKVSTALDIKELLRRKNKNISVLVLRHVPTSMYGFLVHYFLEHVYNILSGVESKKKIQRNTTIVLNEVSDLLSNDEESGSSAGSISNMISKIAKQRRTSNLFLLMDTQIPQELPKLRETLQRIYVYQSSKTSVETAMEIMGISTKVGDITNDDLLIIPHLSPGWYYLFDRDDPVSVHKQQWCRSRIWKDGEDFYSVYENVYGKAKYVSIEEKLRELKRENDESLKAWEIRASLRKRPLKIAKNVKKEQKSEHIENVEEEDLSEKEDREKEKEKDVKNEDYIMDYSVYNRIKETL